MNRSQSRKFLKQAKKKGVSRPLAELYMQFKDKRLSAIPLAEGEKVRLNISAIQSHPDYCRLSEGYRTFVESHAEDVFTVVYDKRRQDNPSVVCLEEDPFGWLFWTGDLVKVEKDSENT